MNNETRQVWTPTITAATPGDLSVVYGATQLGVWAQSGSIVLIGGDVQFTPTYTTAAGALVVSGLPPSILPPPNELFWTDSVLINGTNMSAWPGSSVLAIPAGIVGNSGRIGFNYVGSGINAQSVLITNFTSGTAQRIRLSLTAALPV